MKVLVIGASRRLGLEFVRQYRADGAHATATARDDAGLVRLQPRCTLARQRGADSGPSFNHDGAALAW